MTKKIYIKESKIKDTLSTHTSHINSQQNNPPFQTKRLWIFCFPSQEGFFTMMRRYSTVYFCCFCFIVVVCFFFLKNLLKTQNNTGGFLSQQPLITFHFSKNMFSFSKWVSKWACIFKLFSKCAFIFKMWKVLWVFFFLFQKNTIVNKNLYIPYK